MIAVPDSSNSIALGYAEDSGIPFELGLIRNHYVGRTFIQPTQAVRDLGVRVKFNPVRGGPARAGAWWWWTTRSCAAPRSRKLVALVRQRRRARGALPRRLAADHRTPCFYGIDTPSRRELIGARRSRARRSRDFLGVDSLGYLSLEGLLACEGAPADCCRACFTGRLPGARWRRPRASSRSRSCTAAARARARG